MSDIGKKVQALYFIEKSRTEKTNKVYSEKFEGSKLKFNDISIFDDFNNHIAEHEVKSSIAPKTKNSQIQTAFSQILASWVLGGKKFTGCIIVTTTLPSNKADSISNLELAKLEVIETSNKYISNKGSKLKVEKNDFDILIKKLDFIELKPKNIRGDVWLPDFEDAQKKKFVDHFQKIIPKDSDWNLEAVFYKMCSDFQSNHINVIWLNESVIVKYIASFNVMSFAHIQIVMREYLKYSDLLPFPHIFSNQAFLLSMVDEGEMIEGIRLVDELLLSVEALNRGNVKDEIENLIREKISEKVINWSLLVGIVRKAAKCVV